MPNIFAPYTLLLILAVAVSALLFIASLKQHPSLGAHIFAVLIAAVGLWALTSLFEVCAYNKAIKIFSYKLKYLFIVVVPVAWFFFGLYYSNRLQQLRLKYLAALMILPIITLIMVATNHIHHWVFTSHQWIQTNTYLLLYYRFGFWFWIHTAYCYALISLGSLFIAKHFIDSPASYRGQAITLLIGVLTPCIGNLLYLAERSPFPYLDLTPFAFSISSTAFMLGIVRYRLLDIDPIAHAVVMRDMCDATFVVDLQDRIIDLNPAAETLLNKRQKDLIGCNADQSIGWWRQLPEILDHESPSQPPVIGVQLNDKWRQFQVTQSHLKTKGKPLGRLVMLRDITDIISAEEALRRSEERFKSLSENAPVIIYSIDQSGIINYVNPAWEKILGHNRNEVLEKPLTDFIIQEYDDYCADTLERLISGKTNSIETNITFIHKDGSQRLFNANVAVNSDIEGRVTGIIGIAKDITEKRKLEHQLFQSQKMEAIGILAGGIAHDFNNLLMGIQANLSMLRLASDSSQSTRKKIDRIENQIQSGVSLTRQLLGYARKGKYQAANIDLNKLVSETLQVVKRTNKNILIRHEFNEERVLIKADQGQMEMVLLNLFVNAADAMPQGGYLTVTTCINQYPSSTNDWPNLKAGTYAELIVSDTGLGIDQETIDHIFEPFFTTKKKGQGTGLGLASVYGVVKNHGGHIRVDSCQGKGTTFIVLFPAVDKNPIKPESNAKIAMMPVKGGTILLVDDEKPVLLYSAEMIESLGFRVIPANSGKQAVKIYKKQHNSIDLVILDIIMPEMDGRQVYEALRAINPNVLVIIASGYNLDYRAEEILSKGCYGYLKKPYTCHEVLRVILQVLAQN